MLLRVNFWAHRNISRVYPSKYVVIKCRVFHFGTKTAGSNIITSVEEEQERDLGIGLLFKAIHESLKHSCQCAVATKTANISHDKQDAEDVYV